MPHASHSTGVGRPFGAFHQSFVSRVRHAPHDACALLGVRTMDPSESESSAQGIVCADGGGVSERPSRRRRRFSSPSFMLWWALESDRLEEKRYERTFSSARSNAQLHKSCACQLHRGRCVAQRRGSEQHLQMQLSHHRPTHGPHSVSLCSSTGITTTS
jgi:hypothetical protein